MARMQVSSDEKIFALTKFYGLNENPDGDTKLVLGEATQCKNWQVTRDRNLRRRPGSKTVATIGNGKVQGMWSGYIDGVKHFLAACDDSLYELWDDANARFLDEPINLGMIDTENRVVFFPFSNKVYMLNGKEYMEYDGDRLRLVEGYRPLIYTSLTPAGEQPQGGSMLEEVNKLTGSRRVWYSPDGEATVFQLPEKDLVALDYVKYTATGGYVAPSLYTFDREDGTVTFTTAPTAGTNTIEIGYSGVATFREEVTRMTNFEMYSGTTDTRVFIYGNGTNEAFYSSVDYDGQPRADYFPDLNEVAIGEQNTPLTGIIRHFSNLICFKSNSTYTMTYGTIQTATGDMEAGFYVTPVNREIGNIALGQVRLVVNNPRTVFGNDLYEWRNTSSYTSRLSIDERQARRISDRIYATLSEFKTEDVYCYDDNDNQEYYIVDVANKRALVNNYAADTWYYYDQFDMNSAVSFGGDTYFGTSSGKVVHLSFNYYSDDGVAFHSYWESGSFDFGRPYETKFCSMIWVGVKPESRGSVMVTVQTDRRSNYNAKEVFSYLLDFGDIDFTNFSFDVNRSPKMKKLKIKAKKFCFWKIIFESNDDATSATVLNANMKVHYTGEAK